MAEKGIQWIDVEPGSVVMGSDRRSIIFGGIGPRHEVKIDYSFKISKNPVEPSLAEIAVEEIEAEICSESEWELANSRGLISGGDWESEELADSAQDYWGKACDGRPHFGQRGSPRIIRDWSSRGPKPLSLFPSGLESNSGKRLVIRGQTWSEDPPIIPNKRGNSRIIIEESIISIVVGIIPSFVWAYFNASPGYIRQGWLNLVLGGIFLGLFTAIFWRPRQPTWLLISGNMSSDFED